jgi:hypothetical protein
MFWGQLVAVLSYEVLDYNPSIGFHKLYCLSLHTLDFCSTNIEKNETKNLCA